jgi:NifU-like protein involved in Fe-S cluster formation
LDIAAAPVSSMDEVVVKYYRRILRDGFHHAGSIERPSIFLDTQTENLPLCGQVAGNSMRLYANVAGDVIEAIKYLCICDPTANVVIEVLCDLVEGMALAEAESLTPEDFSRAIGCRDDDYLQRAGKAIEFLRHGITRYYEQRGRLG